jgi:hypothetical protein
MLRLIEVSFDQYDPSNLGGYQDVSQEILNLPFLLYTYLYNQYSRHNVVNYWLLVTNFIIFVFSRFRTNLFAENHSVILERTEFDIIQKSSKFLLQIMTLVSSANNIGSDKEYILSGRSLIEIMCSS